MTQAAQNTGEFVAPLELLGALNELGSRLARIDAAPAAIEAAALILADAFSATHAVTHADEPSEELVAADLAEALAIDAARLAGRVGSCRLSGGAEPFALLVPIRAPLPPFELLVFQRRMPFST